MAAAIDALHRDSERQTRTQTASASRAGIVSVAGELAQLPGVVGVALAVAVLVALADALRARRFRQPPSAAGLAP